MKRTLFNTLNEHLQKKQISLIIGARQVGKTTLMQQLFVDLKRVGKPAYFLTLEDPVVLSMLNEHPEKLFQVLPPLDDKKRSVIFIDEIQYLENPTNFLKYHYDQYKERLKFVVSGSSSFYLDTKFKDSLAGRKRIFWLPTLSFEELLIFRNREELTQFPNTGTLPQLYVSELNRMLHEYLLYGGYPEVVLETDPNEKQALLAEIAESYVKRDALDARLKDPDAYLKILTVLADRVSGLYNSSDIGRDIQLKHLRVENYVRVMEKSFHITRVKPFFRNITKELKRRPKIYFNDLGLRNHFLGNYNPVALREDKGAILENYVFRRLLDFYKPDEIRFWRTQKKQEVDFIVGKNQAFEVKFNKNSYDPRKYAYFKSQYPEIPLQLIHFDNVLQIKL
jgi:hypothetical protein